MGTVEIRSGGMEHSFVEFPMIITGDDLYQRYIKLPLVMRQQWTEMRDLNGITLALFLALVDEGKWDAYRAKQLEEVR